jgi:TonB family protein
MNTLIIIYLAKTAFYMAAFYLVYYVMLSKDTLYRRNRVFILLSILSAIILPFITIQISKPITFPVFGKALSEIIIYGTKNGSAIINGNEAGISTMKMIWIMYLSGVLLFGLKLVIDFSELVVLIARQKARNSRIIIFHGLNTSGFSALGYVFINMRLTPEESAEIIKHEQNHIDQNHFLDIVLIEIVSVFQWFNPFIHMFNRSLRAVHEFQADEGCLNTGIPVCSYQNLLLNQVFKSNIFTLTNCFSNPTLIKKRMIMMTKERSGAQANLKLIMVLPVVALLLVAFSSYVEKPVPDLVQVEMASFSPSDAPVPGNNPVSSTLMESAALSGTETPPPPPPPPPASTLQETTIEVSASEAVPSEEEAVPTEVFVVVEEMPSFPGGDSEMMNFIYENIKYPENALENNIQGRVILRFCVTYKGEVNQVSVLKGVDPELDNEAMRVVSILPQWKPGKQGGKTVNVWYSLPINFALKQ